MSLFKYCIRMLGVLCGAAAFLAAGPAEARRVALVIGNAAHQHLPALKNPVNDATAVADALAKLGFDTVVLKTNVGRQDFRAALSQLSSEAKGAEAAVLFFAGNGIEVNGRNYLIPVDAKLAKGVDADEEAITLDTVIAQVDGAKVGLVILDACRDNPFGARWAAGARGLHRGINVVRGLSPVEPRGHNLFLVYAAEAGAVAEDGAGRHSPFTEALLKHLPTPGLELRHLVVRVRADVIAATAGRQVPAYWDRFNGEFVFKPAR